MVTTTETTNSMSTRLTKISDELHDMGYEAAKQHVEPIVKHVKEVMSEAVLPDIDLFTEWNGDVDILVDLYSFPVSLCCLVSLEDAEDDEKIREAVAKQLKEFDGREYIKESGEFIKDEYDMDDFELTGRVWDVTCKFHELSELI